MEPHAVVEDLDVAENRAFCFGTGGEDAPVDEFGFQRGPEALHFGVVVAVACPTHPRSDTVGAQKLAVRLAGVLAATVGVVEQPARGPLRLDRPLEGAGDQSGGHRVVRRPADDLAAARSEHARDVEPAFPGRHVGDVRLPHLAGPAGRLPSLGQVVGRDGAEVAAVGRAGPKAPLLPCAQPRLSHQPRHPVATAWFTRAPQRHRQPWTAVGASARLEKRARLYDGKSAKLAPLYDLVCTQAYPNLSQDMAMKIGDERKPDRVFAKNWRMFLKDAGIGQSAAERRLMNVVRHVQQQAQAMAEKAMQGTQDVALVVAANYQRLLSLSWGNE